MVAHVQAAARDLVRTDAMRQCLNRAVRFDDDMHMGASNASDSAGRPSAAATQSAVSF